MAKGIYVSAMTPGSGEALISLGLADTLHRRADKIGFFRPISEGDDPSADPVVAMIGHQFDLPQSRCRAGLGTAEARSLLASGRRDEIDTACVEIYGRIADECDIVIVEGTSLTGQDAAVEFDLNARLANNLGCLVLAVVSAAGLTAAEAADAVDVARRELAAANCSLLAMMVNRADDGESGRIAAAVRPGASRRPVYVLEEIPEVSRPTMAEVADQLQLRQVAGNRNLEREIAVTKVAAMNVGNFLAELGEGALVIVPGDRADVLVATLASALSAEFPVPAGVVLTGGLEPDPNIASLLDEAPFPVLAHPADTYSTARLVSEVRGEITGNRPRRTAAALGAWSNVVDEAELVDRLTLPRAERMTPLRFLHGLVDRARADRMHIVLPEGLDARILQAAEILYRRDVCELTILGPERRVRELAANEGVELQGINLVDPETSDLREEFATEYFRLREHKGLDMPTARERMAEGAYFGTMMVHLGHSDGMVSGAAHTTANTIRPALEFIKTREDVKIVSSVFLMLLQDRVLVYGDCAVNPEPDEEQLADIASASADTAAEFGVDPRVAMLSYSTGSSGSGGSVSEVRRATDLLRERRPELPVEGPIQYDAAVNASVAESKLPESSVAGQATVFIFPDLNTGNNTYKAVQQSSGAVAVGPVLQGLRKPVNDLSRGCTVDDIVNTVAITAIQAQS
ncbi:phosphate acetyltransferase [Arthrobacter castelli]|uniref:phosphate acetyltransferase n=1 Tax=Arthrobacter castelli TaxID=271431 RepID=UPI0004206764|nr:phosphate acetyltransferase [Arthrobacter castelli]